MYCLWVSVALATTVLVIHHGFMRRLSSPSGAQMLELQEIFDEHDFDGSGMLSLDEIAKVIETLMEACLMVLDCGFAVMIRQFTARFDLQADWGNSLCILPRHVVCPS